MGNLCSKGSKSSTENLSVNSEDDGSAKKNEDNHSVSKKVNGGQAGAAVSPPPPLAAPAPAPSPVPPPSASPAPVNKARRPGDSGDSVSSPGGPSSVPPPLDLPLEVKKQTEVVQNLLLGRVSKVTPITKGKKITLYVCTSFSQDFRLEKGQLHTEVYPSLRAYCAGRGYELNITDLHWKTDLESGQGDLKFPELCLGELQRQLQVSYVLPVLFLSDQLGESLLPKTMEAQDFTVALNNVGDPESKALLEKWYALDKHAEPPCYRLKQLDKLLPNIRSEVETERSEAIAEWRGIVEQILGVMLRVFSEELRDTYLTTVIEQEIHNSIFMSREVGKRSVWVNRVKDPNSKDPSEGSEALEKEKSRRLEALYSELKAQLVGDHVLRLQVNKEEGDERAYLSDLSSQLNNKLTKIIDEVIEEDGSKALWKTSYGIDGSLSSELMRQSLFCQQSAKCCVPYENVLNLIKGYIGGTEGGNKGPLLIHGEKGCGKTCLLSKAIEQTATWFPESLVLFRFVGISTESRSLVQILRSLVTQLSLLFTGKTFWTPHNTESYKKEWRNLLATPPLKNKAGKIVVFIDGVDELDPLVVSELSFFLEEPLPSSSMRVVLSCSDATPVFQHLKTGWKGKEDNVISVSSLSSEGAEGLLTATLLQYCHSADSDLQKKITQKLKPLSPSALYIKVLAWLASLSDSNISEADFSGMSESKAAINTFCDYLEKSLGKEKVAYAVSLLCASRYGLCDSEILDLLAHSPLFCSKVTLLDWAPASIFLAQITQLLGPFLEWGLAAGGSMVIRWRDQLVREIAKERYFKGESRKVLLEYFQQKQVLQSRLHEWLSGVESSQTVVKKSQGQNFEQQTKLGTAVHQETWKDKKNGRFLSVPSDEGKRGNRHHRRKLEEEPFQSFHISSSIKKNYLTNVSWLLEKLDGSSVYNLIEDLTLECNCNHSKLDAELSLLLSLLELSAPALNYDGSQLFSQAYGRLHHQKGLPALLKKLTEGHKGQGQGSSFLPLTPSLLHSPEEAGGLSAYSTKEEGSNYFDQITRLKEGNQFVVSLSTKEEEVVVWKTSDSTPTAVRTLRGIENPNNFQIIDNQRVVILCGRELQIFNLDDLTFITKLKGVMNQKMPFFGLHDDNHIVSISRNRMYVNLMNVTTGECISTFKVGEDRFLNSLVISENGKMLVCGDETQKPFPLLVWTLNEGKGKLVYDLRIPHHEFLTALSAITKEGNFVCCVCREVDDPGPNFIVVYDLTSGTLFKKWKPGFNTHAIAISAQGGCVIDALEDNRILVWDLVTGACRHSLSKHSAPVDTLLLDQKGARCLSYDSAGRDRSVCLWDLSSGLLLALFTPDLQYSACELSNDGNSVTFGFKGRKTVSVIQYRGNDSDLSEEEETYGNDENTGKVTDLKAK